MSSVSTLSDDDRAHLYALYYGQDALGLCGCNVPGQAWEEIRWILSLCPLYEDRRWEHVETKYGRGGAHIILGTLDRVGLLEHGGTITGSWLTHKGRWVIDALNAIDGDLDDELGQVGYPHDGDDCPTGCPIARTWAGPPNG